MRPAAALAGLRAVRRAVRIGVEDGIASTPAPLEAKHRSNGSQGRPKPHRDGDARIRRVRIHVLGWPRQASPAANCNVVDGGGRSRHASSVASGGAKRRCTLTDSASGESSCGHADGQYIGSLAKSTTSAVPPEFEINNATSSGPIRPGSPCTASDGCRVTATPNWSRWH